MSNFKFSAKTNSFYPESLREYYEEAGTLPDDLIDVSDDTYSILSGQPPEGKVRGSKKGNPVWVNIPAPTPEQARQNATLRKQQLQTDAEEEIAPLARAEKYWIITNEEKARLAALEIYTVLLSRVIPDDAPNISWPEKPE